MIEYTDDEIEEDRARSLAEHADHDELRERYQHPIAYSEVLHAAYMLMETVDTYLGENPSILFDEVAYKHAHNAHTALFNLYQRIGSLRYEHEKNSTAPDLRFGSMIGAWNEVFFNLGAAELSNTIKAGLAKSLFVYSNEYEEGQQPPNVTSFRQMLKFLEDHPCLPGPSINVNLAGQFTLCYSNGRDRITICFKYIIDLAEVVTTTSHETEVSVGYADQPITKIVLPEWLINPC